MTLTSNGADLPQPSLDIKDNNLVHLLRACETMGFGRSYYLVFMLFRISLVASFELKVE
ncbi:hypothetical protein BDW75DRAFT_123472 [Aspergillus navahoensis]